MCDRNFRISGEEIAKTVVVAAQSAQLATFARPDHDSRTSAPPLRFFTSTFNFDHGQPHHGKDIDATTLPQNNHFDRRFSVENPGSDKLSTLLCSFRTVGDELP